MLSVAADEYAGAGGDFCTSVGIAIMVLAQPAGGRHGLDGWRKRGSGRSDWLYWACDPTYSAAVRLNRSSRVTAGCALAGAIVLLLADVVARLVLASAELPIGVVTATMGAPVFIWLLLKAAR